jgi:hypothetical protein
LIKRTKVSGTGTLRRNATRFATTAAAVQVIIFALAYAGAWITGCIIRWAAPGYLQEIFRPFLGEDIVLQERGGGTEGGRRRYHCLDLITQLVSSSSSSVLGNEHGILLSGAGHTVTIVQFIGVSATPFCICDATPGNIICGVYNTIRVRITATTAVIGSVIA